MHTKRIIESGVPLAKAKHALIMLHGRGASAEDILSLQHEFSLKDFYIVAPQATNYTWYPQSFLAPIKANEPWLSSALDVLERITVDITAAGIPSENIFVLGFSQGACLTLEFTTRYTRKWGGVIAFTGGLIGEKLDREKYKGDFLGTKVFIGTSDIDPHVPLQRSEESRSVMEECNANVTLKVYPNMGHTINHDEIQVVNELFFKANK